MRERILIVDDSLKMRRILRRILEDKGFAVECAEDGETCLSAVGSFEPDLILLDLKMPKKDGMETLEQLQRGGYQGKIIILTAYGTIPSAVQAVHKGAYDFLTKTSDTNQILLSIRRALENSRLERELAEAKSRLDQELCFEGIITKNSQMEKLLDLVKKIAKTDVSVLISGESGTGKELFAKAIHQQSHRSEKSLVALNCGAIPENLIESELFGYMKGAFTGAVRSKKGLVTQADGGTLFLDEVAELGPDAQVKLLRFAQSGEFISVGDLTSQTVDVRIIAATNIDLEDAIAKGAFRSDLFYRLSVVSMVIPPLRERTEDIPLLIDHFVTRFGNQLGKADFHFSPQALESMRSYDWPGNVRELENAIHGALVVAEQSPIGPEFLPGKIRDHSTDGIESNSQLKLTERLARNKEHLEKKSIIETLELMGNHITRTAEALGISRTTLFRRMKKYKIKR